VKVEQALGLLPALEAIGPLRGLVLASSSPDERSRWGSAAPFLTVGKWTVGTEALQRAIPRALERITAHLSSLYHEYAAALDATDRGDPATAASHLLAAARLEAAVGRSSAALQWGEVALRLAEGLHQRKSEIEVLVFCGRVATTQRNFALAARHYQRALVLAEAELDHVGAVAANEGQGMVALSQGQLQGAAVWLGRGLRLADGPDDGPSRARMQRALAEVLHRQGNPEVAAELLQQSRETLEEHGDALEVARTLDAQGRLDLALARHQPALAAFREALAWERRAGTDPQSECDIRLHLADLHLSLGQMTDAEQETRTAERLAIQHNLGRRLVEIYARLGTLRGRQGAETGFVFFEQALQLCRLLDPGSAAGSSARATSWWPPAVVPCSTRSSPTSGRSQRCRLGGCPPPTVLGSPALPASSSSSRPSSRCWDSRRRGSSREG
jgi:tetratricopeptide (TPR) repeat protein